MEIVPRRVIESKGVNLLALLEVLKNWHLQTWVKGFVLLGAMPFNPDEFNFVQTRLTPTIETSRTPNPKSLVPTLYSLNPKPSTGPENTPLQVCSTILFSS